VLAQAFSFPADGRVIEQTDPPPDRLLQIAVGSGLDI
jgi:hypothetical protein